jgi:uncharacterized protein with FMN-binding domain
MLRAVLTLGGTAVGLAALLSFKTHMAGTADAAPAPPSTPAATSPAAGMSGPAPAATHPAGQGNGAGAGKTPPVQAPAAAQARTVDGPAEQTQYGPMQVQVTLAGQKITNVTVLQRTDDGSESDQIDSFAIPKLTSETLAAQSAKIDAVSGASYTSSGYIQSLQSALDKAGA